VSRLATAIGIAATLAYTGQEHSRGGTMAATQPGGVGELPSWNLDDLYPGPDSPALQADLARAATDATKFREAYQGRLAELPASGLAEAIGAYERLQDLLGRIGSYASLRHAADLTDPAIGQFHQTMLERTNAVGSELLFFTLEINRIEDAALSVRLADPALAHWAPWLRDVRVFRPHQLSDEIERLLYEKYVAGHAAWSRLYDETCAAQRFEIGGKELTGSEAFDLLENPDRARREEAARALEAEFGRSRPVISLITNTLAKDKEIEDRWRHFARPISARNLSNLVEDEVVDALIAAVRDSYPRIAHRFYALKAGWLGFDKLAYWDRNAPLPEAEDRIVPWPEAERIVLDAYGAFSPRLAEIGGRFFHEGWIDAAPRPGKASGAFSHGTVPSAHPYILLNYMGRTRDVMTIAHELGHGVHQVLAGRQGALMADTPLTLAETASVFGEMLTFRKLLSAAESPARRRVMLADKVEDMINTVIRQVAFAEFERKLHDERREGELTPDRISELWLGVHQESLGPAFDLAGYEHYWVAVPHFIHTPFYVYAYAFGDCLVNSLYAVYQNAAEGFAERYLDLLAAGGTRRHRELLAPFGLDAADPGFWQKGLGVIAGFIDELEALG
jgi:oligoendopeptidase F